MKKILLISLIFLFTIQAIADEKWTKAEFQNFTIVGTGSEKQLKQVGNKLEQFRQTLSLLLPNSKLNSSLPTTVYAFSSYDNFKSYLSKEFKNKSVGGFFTATPESNYIVLPIENRGFDIYDVIYHEYFHYVMSKNLKNSPLWLNEGLAEYYSTFEINDEGNKFKLGLPIGRRVAELRERTFIPLDTLFAVNHKSPEYNERNKVGVFYAQSWALVHFLIQGNERQRRTQFNTFINYLAADMPPNEAFQKAFQADYKQIEKELREYINKFTFPYIQYSVDTKISWEDTAKITKLTEVEAKIIQSDLLILTNNIEEAEKRLNDAVKLDEKFAGTYRLLGKLRVRQRNYPEARKNFEKAISLEPNEYLNNYYFAGAMWNEGKTAEAIKLYQEAIRLKPDVARLHASLGNLYHNLNRDDESIASYSQAAKLDIDESAYPYILARLLFTNGKNFLASARAKYFIRLEGWKNDSTPYVALLMYFCFQRDNNPDYASQTIELALEKFDKNEWVYSVFRYLNKQITEAELLTIAANNNDKQTEAYCYIGLNQLLQGKNAEAIENLKWVKNNGNKTFIEYEYAIKELERLVAPPKSPVK
jgi:Flp pilus assembly protein TadD